MEINRTKFSRPNSYGLKSEFDGTYRQVGGAVETGHGYVNVYSEKGPRFHITVLRMTIDGHHYQATVRRYYTSRGCVTLAVRFADQCADFGAGNGNR